MVRARAVVMGVAMLAAAGASQALRPTENMAAERPVADLEVLIPETFGDWRIDPNVTPVEPSPEVQASLRRIYSQTLARTYVNSAGQRVMLAVAYGDGIDRQLDIHRPEYCYAAQGFEVSAYVDQVLEAAFGGLPLRRLVARQGPRVEPISYWITVGDTAVSSTVQRKLLKIRYGLTGQIGAGMLVRVSTIDRDSEAAWHKQDDFIRAMIGAMPEEYRRQLVGERLSG